MNITVSQKDKKISIDFQRGKIVDNYYVDKADEFLVALDIFIKKRNIDITVLSPFGRSPVGGKNTDLKFANVSILTERIIRATIAGLRF